MSGDEAYKLQHRPLDCTNIVVFSVLLILSVSLPCLGEDLRLEKRFYDPNLCGPIALYCVCLQFDIRTSIAELAELSSYKGTAVSIAGIRAAAEAKGLRMKAMKADIAFLKGIRGPAILNLPDAHFCTFLGWKGKRAIIQDPPHPLKFLTPDEIENQWTGYVLTFELAKSAAAKR